MIRKNLTGTIDSWLAWIIKDLLNSAKEEEVRIILTSNGGNVAQAIAISDMMAAHGNVTVEFSGVAASAATWLAFGAKNVVMHEDTLWLCHQCSAPICAWENMNADDLDAFITKLQNEKKSLEVIDAIIAKKYLNRCSKKGKNLQDVRDLMKEERYLAPDDCLEWGFVDEVLPTKTASNVVNCAMLDFLGLPKASVENIKPSTVDEESLISRILDKVKNLFAKEPVNNIIPNKQTIEFTMNKKFSFVNALLGIEGVNESEGNLTLTNEQLQAIENRLAELDKAEKAIDNISDKIKGITGIENKVAALSLVIDKMPAAAVASTSKPVEEQGEKEEVNIEDADEINDFVKGFAKKK